MYLIGTYFLTVITLCGIDIHVAPPLEADAPPMRYVCGLVEAAGESLVGQASVHVATIESFGSSADLTANVPETSEGFALCPVPEEQAVYVVGRDWHGALYGMIWLAERLAIEGAAALERQDARAPAFRYRDRVDLGANTPAPERGPQSVFELDLRHTCNARNIVSARSYIYLDEVDPRLVTGVENHRRTVDARRAALREQIAALKAWGLEPVSGCGPFLDIGDIDKVIEVFGEEVSEDGLTLSPALDKPWEIWQAYQRLFLRDFPEIGGLRASMQDFPQRYQIAAARGPKAEALGPVGGFQRMVERAYDVVVDEFGKRMIITSWGNPPDTYPLNDPQALRTIFENISPRNICLQNNHCEHDFYLPSPFNDNFGVTNIPQGIMIQMDREYEGQGYLPVYIGPRIRDDMSRCRRLGATETAEGRMWYSKNFYEPLSWTRWNLYAWYRACWEPEGDPWEWARDRAVIEFGPEGAEPLADALMMTQEIARRTFYVNGFSSRKRDAYAITHRKCFTDGRHYYQIVKDPHGDAYRDNHVRGKVPLLLAEAEETRALSAAMITQAEAATREMRSADDAERVIESFRHFDAIVNLLTHYQQAIWLWYYKDEPDLPASAARDAREQCAFHARRALDLFAAYKADYGLYRDAGMAPLLRRYLRELGAELPPAAEPPTVLAIPRIHTTFAIDGRLGDEGWPEPALTLTDNDYAVALRFARGDEALYVSAEVQDTPAVPIRVGRVYRADSIGILFDTDNDEREDAIYYLLLDDATGKPCLLTIMRDMVLASRDYEDREKAPANDPGTAVAMMETPGGYTWECAIPWSMLGGIGPDSESTLGLAVAASDADAPGQLARRLWYPAVPDWRDPPPYVFAYTGR